MELLQKDFELSCLNEKIYNFQTEKSKQRKLEEYTELIERKKEVYTRLLKESLQEEYQNMIYQLKLEYIESNVF